MPTSKSLSNLVINKIQSQSLYNALKDANLVNDDELYLVEGDSSQEVTGVKGSEESSYRTGQISLSADNVGAIARTPTVNAFQASTTDLTAGVSSLTIGTVYLVYEE